MSSSPIKNCRCAILQTYCVRLLGVNLFLTVLTMILNVGSYILYIKWDKTNSDNAIKFQGQLWIYWADQGGNSEDPGKEL